ncbi:hypothetical protein P7C70_g1453, partial [Phenoliferia sp. Uapishka_3]
MSSFTPKHSQPVSVSSLVELEPDTLSAEITRLQNSISHLKRSNQELYDFIHPPDGAEGEEELDEETRKEFEESVRENAVTIARQEERILMVRLAMERKLGVDATNSHYDLITNAAPVAKKNTLGEQANGAVSMNENANGEVVGGALGAGVMEVESAGEVDEGMYL